LSLTCQAQTLRFTRASALDGSAEQVALLGRHTFAAYRASVATFCTGQPWLTANSPAPSLCGARACSAWARNSKARPGLRWPAG